MTVVVDGKAIAAEVIEETKAKAAQMAATGVKAGLAVVIVGDDPASHAYVAAKGRKAKECGFHSLQFTLPESTTQKALADLINSLNENDEVDGILVQLPLPKHLDSEAIIQSIDPAKDVDGLNTINAGKIVTGDLASGLTPCTPAGAMVLVERVHGKDLSGLHAVVVGRSNLFGKPMAALLLAANATVTSAHSRTKDLAEICQLADILVVAVGRAEMVKNNWVKDGATVIDVGINRVAGEDGKGKLVGDVEYATVSETAGAITPVPGGVGPMTIAMLMANTLKAASLRAGDASRNVA